MLNCGKLNEVESRQWWGEILVDAQDKFTRLSNCCLSWYPIIMHRNSILNEGSFADVKRQP